MTRRTFVRAAAAAAGLASVLTAGCDRGDQAPRDPGPLRVVVTIPPLAGLTQRIAPADAQLTTLLPPGRSEHGHELSPSDLTALGKADVVVMVGLGLEPQVEAFLSRHPREGRRVVQFAEIVGLADEAGADDHDHSDHGHDDHGHEHHDHGSVDPHLWLDPALVAKLVPAVGDALAGSMADAGAAPEQAAEVERNAEQIVQEVLEADARWSRVLGPIRGRAIVTHHAAWSRLAGRYGLEVVAVIRSVEGQEPTPGEVEAAVRAIREQGAAAVFVEPQFSADLASRIADQAGVQVGTLDPLGDGDWFAMMDRNVAELARLLGTGDGSAAEESGRR